MPKISVELDIITADLVDNIPHGKRSEIIRKAIREYVSNGDYLVRELIAEVHKLEKQLEEYGYTVTIQKKILEGDLRGI